MDLPITLQSLFTAFFFFLLYIIVKNELLTKKPTTYGLRSYPIIGHLPHLIQNEHRFLDWINECLLQSPTHTMGLRTSSTYGIFTANPANVEHMLKLNTSKYPKGDGTIIKMEDFLGHGILNADGEDWKWQRRTASNEFNKKSFRDFIVETVRFEIFNRLLPILNQGAEKGVTVELQDVFERFAFDTICRVVFGEDPAYLAEDGGTSSSKEFMAAFSVAQDISADRFLELSDYVWRIKKFLNIGKEKRLTEANSIVQRYFMNIIRPRMSKRMELDGREDLLSSFASNKDHNEVVLLHAVTSFILAGRESSSTALTWFFWLVSTRPDIQKKIMDEIKCVRTSNKITTETFSFDDLKEMNYLHAAISELMRLYPPVPLITISCKEDDVMPDGTFVGKDWLATFSPYTMGRSEEIWGKDCMDFKPERWLDENGVFKPESPFRYPIFNGGARLCLGKEMSYIQIKYVVACVLERFQIKPLGKEGIPEHVLSLVLRMKGGLPVQLKKREN